MFHLVCLVLQLNSVSINTNGPASYWWCNIVLAIVTATPFKVSFAVTFERLLVLQPLQLLLVRRLLHQLD
jgi:hypothetical protein